MARNSNIKGITIEIEGKSTGLDKVLKTVTDNAVNTSNELKNVDKALKFNPSNVTLVAQKQKLLSDQVQNTSEKLNTLKDAQAEVNKQFENGDIAEEQYRGFQREVIETESQLKTYQQQIERLGKEQESLATNTKRLETFFEATGSTVDDFSDILGVRLTNAIKDGKASSSDLETAINKIARSSLGAETDVGKLKTALDRVDDNGNIDDVTRDIQELANASDDTAPKLDKLTNIMKSDLMMQAADKLGEVSDKIFDVGQEAIEAAANVKAIDAQFEQVFGELEGYAEDVVNQLGEDFGILPSRLRAPLASVTSMFKGLGYDTETAINMASEAMTIASDSAAFYDKSLEDANGSLNSFLKGSYEGGEAIGLFATETQMAAFAIKNNLIEATEEQQKFAEKSAMTVEKNQKSYSGAVSKYGESSLQAREAQMKLNEALEAQENGPDLTSKWSKLTEAQKQSIRLNYASEMQKQSGAFGQAAREADGYENVMGNLNAVQEEFMAAIGDEALTMFIDLVQSLIPVIQSAVQWFKELDPTLKQLLTIIVAVTGGVGLLLPIVIAIKAAMLAFGATLLPIVGVIAAIIAAISAVIFAFTNWGTITDWLAAKWQSLKDFGAGIWESIKTIVLGALESVTGGFNSAWTTVQTVWSNIGNFISTTMDTAKTAIGNAIETIKGFLNFQWKWPKLPMPHFSVSGSMNPLKWIDEGVPKIGVEWYAKGGILTKPTVFGMNGSNLMAGGEAGREAVLPLNASTLGGIGAGIAETLNFSQMIYLLSAILELLESIDSKEFSTYLNSQKVSEELYQPMDAQGKWRGQVKSRQEGSWA